MSETNENELGLKRATESDWWLYHMSELSSWTPSSVFLVCTGPHSSVTPVGAWFYTAANLFNHDREPFFPEIVLIVPPGTNKLNYRERFKDAIAHSFEISGKEPPKEISRYLSTREWPWVESNAEKLLAELEKVPEGSAVSIASAERLRFPKMQRPLGPSVLTHTGQRVSHSSGEDLMLPHLHELIRGLLNLALDRNLSVVVFVENVDFEMDKLPEDLRSHKALAIASAPYGEVDRSRFRATIEALRISRTQSLEAAIEFIRHNILDPAYQAHAMSFVYGDHGLWNEAWRAVEAQIDALRSLKEVGILLNLAQSAEACGEARVASELLKEAFSMGIEMVESFNAAANVAQAIGETEVLDHIIAEMQIAYPHHPMTVARSFSQMMAAGQYHKAAELADTVGARFEAAWARLRDQKTPNWDAFLQISCEMTREQEALAKCTEHALDIGQSTQARAFFKRIPETLDTTRDLRAQLLFDIVIKEVGFAETNVEIEKLCAECSSVFGYLAANPVDRTLRSRVSHWFESCADDGSCIILLLSTLMSAFERSKMLFEPGNATNETEPWSFANVERNSDVAVKFVKAVAAASSGRPFGHAIAPPEYAASVSDEIMQGLGVCIQEFTTESDLSGIALLLQCLNLACRIRREPTWDFEAAIQLTGTIASNGKISDGLNLAENILIFWGDGAGEFGAARTAHAWSCMAEVYHRSRNPVTSLLYLVLCFESMASRPAQQHAVLLKHKLRLATRILRDLNLAEYTRRFLLAELKLIQAFPREHEARKWIVTEIGCRLRLIDQASPQKDIDDLVSSIRELLEDENETEWSPPVSAGVSVLSIIRHYGFPVPEELMRLIQRRLPQCPLGSQRLFRYFLLQRPSLTDVKTAMSDLLEGNMHDDEGFALSSLEGLLRRAVSAACENRDAELFALAANWLSQPSLSASRASRETSLKQPHAELASLPELYAAEGSIDPQQLRDYCVSLQRQVERTQSNSARTVELPICAAKYVASPDEALCLLAHNADYHLCCLVVRRSTIEGPTQLPKSSWNAEKYLTWSKTYPTAYSWDRHFDALGPYDTPDEDEIRRSLVSLQPQLPVDVKTITVLPEAELFGFSYFMTNAPIGWVGESSVCVTAPSLAWLAAVRQLPNPRLNLKGWLGDPSSTDFAVLRPRNELKPLFVASGGVLIETPTPQHIGKSGVAVLLAHGSRGTFGSFVGVNDVGQFTNEDLADSLGQSVCVVLFVCNAGRNDHRAFTQETFGVIGQLLRRGVRAVIAPPAPLRNELPALWFPSFYDALQKGRTVGQAYAVARDTIRQSFSHPCAWGALQLFGDAQLAFDVESS